MGHKWDLSRLSAGERSALRRSAGIMKDDASLQAVEAFYRALEENCRKYEEDAWFAAMCMQCLWREEDHPSVRAFPEILRGIYQNPDATDSTRKKCTGYLDLYWSDDGFLLGKICSLVRKMRADHPETMPDFEALADDLVRWNHGDRYVQRRWLNTIARNQEETNKKEDT